MLTRSKTEESRRGLFIVIAGIVVIILVAAGIVFMSLNDKETPAPANLDTAAQAGKVLYLSTGNCNSCHPGEGRKGSLTGPRLSTVNLSDQSLRQYIRQGKGMMPGNPNLTDDEISNLVSYLKAIKAAAS